MTFTLWLPIPLSKFVNPSRPFFIRTHALFTNALTACWFSPTIFPKRHSKKIIISRNGKPPSQSSGKIRRMLSSLIFKNISLQKEFSVLVPALEKWLRICNAMAIRSPHWSQWTMGTSRTSSTYFYLMPSLLSRSSSTCPCLGRTLAYWKSPRTRRYYSFLHRPDQSIYRIARCDKIFRNLVV